jgi:hypothetical protein
MSHFLLEMSSDQPVSARFFSSILGSWPVSATTRIGTPSGHWPGRCIIIHQRAPPAAGAGETELVETQRVRELWPFGFGDASTCLHISIHLVVGVSREPEEFPILR